MDKIIYQPWGGLGDNLQYSTLPELYHKQGHDVYISNQNCVRNQEIHDLVWGCNPYIKGISDKLPNIGWVPELPLQKKFDSIVTNWEITHGFGAINKYPKIYYTPKKTKGFSNKRFLDINSTSLNYNKNIERLIPKLKDLYLIKFTNTVSEKSINIDLPTVSVDSIYEYCDLIASCDAFITLSSGGVVLASAIKQNQEIPKIIELRHPGNINYIFDNVKPIKIPTDYT